MCICDFIFCVLMSTCRARKWEGGRGGRGDRVRKRESKRHIADFPFFNFGVEEVGGLNIEKRLYVD